MTSFRVRRTASLFVIFGLVTYAGCQRDPAAAARAFVASGDKYIAAGQIEAGVLEYRNALSHQPAAAAVHYKLAVAYERLRQPQHAYEAYARVTELDAGYTDANLRVAATMLAAERHEEAERLARRVLDKDPNNLQALALAAGALDGMGQSAAARRRLDQALKIDARSPEVLIAEASWQTRRGDLRPAAETLRQAVAYDPQSAHAWTALANAEWRINEVARAEAALEKVFALSADKSAAQRFLASLYLQTDRAALAEPHLKALAETSRMDRLALADYYLALEKKETAASILRDLTDDRDPAIAAQARLRRAVLARSGGAPRDAHAELDRALKHPSAELQALIIKSELLRDEGQLDAALEHARKAAALQSGGGEASYELAMVHLARGELADAERELKRARDRISAPTLVDMELARLAMARRDVKTAVSVARQLVASDPSPTGYALLSQALRASGNVKEAGRALALARDRWPDDVELATELGFVELAARRPDRARAAFERAMRASPASSASRSGLVLAYVADRRFDEAKSFLDTWRSSAPDDVPLAILASQIALVEGDVSRAEQTLVEAARRAPRHAGLAERLGQIYLASGNRTRALEQYEKVAALAPGSVEALTAVGMLKQESGDRAGAIAAYQRAVDLSSEAGIAANNLAWLYAEDDRLDEAARIAERAVAVLRRAPESLDTLGWVHQRQGRFDRAIKLLTEAAGKAPRNALYRYHLALAYVGAERRAEARAQLERALSIESDFADARRALLELSGPQTSRN